MTTPRMKQVELFEPMTAEVERMTELEAERMLRMCLSRLGQFGVRTSFVNYGKDIKE